MKKWEGSLPIIFLQFYHGIWAGHFDLYSVIYHIELFTSPSMADPDSVVDSIDKDILTELMSHMTKILRSTSYPTPTTEAVVASISIKLDSTNYALWS